MFRRLICSCLFVSLIALGTPVYVNGETVVAKRLGVIDKQPDSGPFVKVGDQYMVPYLARIPGTDVNFEMMPIQGGEFLLGSPEPEVDRKDDEGPQIKVNVDPMWVAKTEVTWQQYTEFMDLHVAFQEFQMAKLRIVDDTNRADAVTAPTPLYEPTHTFKYGDDPNQPATTMTQYAAQQYTKWLSGISGQQYRLPTEAEWEYAARARTTTAYSWGDDDKDLDDFAWFFDNSPEGPVDVGTKKPNAFGLYDMHGSVGEWTVNHYTDNGYSDFVDKQPINAIDVVVWPTSESPSVIRGGTWQDFAPELRSAARLASADEEDWKSKDPNIPLSAWWHTTDPTRGIGFRVFRSFQPLPKDTITKFWDTIAEDILEVVQYKIDDGRANVGVADPSLPSAIKKVSR